MIDANTLASAAHVPCLISGEMMQRMQTWEDLYRNRAAWQKKRVRSMRLPATIARELKRLTLTEFSASVSEDELDHTFQRFLPQLRRQLDFGIAMGGMLLKPCYTSGGIVVDLVAQNAYLPVCYNNDCCTGLICPEEVAIGKNYYTRIELHQFDPIAQTHTIQQSCFRSGRPGMIGVPCSLSEVPQWAGILPKKTFTNVKKPLFSLFQMPDSNNCDPTSPLGVSAYADAVDFIRDADEQWERILWELESSERAINASADLFRWQGGRPVLPKGRERMYQLIQPPDSKTFFETFSPEIRDSSYFNALNQIFRRIETAVGLSYGTLSEVSDVEKTAEEVRSSKQRSFVRVSDMQANLRTALEDLLYGMQYYRDYYANQQQTEAVISCTFGDGVLEDSDKEYQRRVQMVRDKIMKPEVFLAWYFGCSEAEARDMMPESQDPGGLFDGAF